MSCQSAAELLPKELLEQVQEYADGRTLYIPKKQENKKRWGENTDTKQFMASRNFQIRLDCQNGISIRQLAEKYFLSEKSIQRILKKDM